MKFNPISREVFTDQGKFLKKLDCPYQMNWESMAKTAENQRICKVCERSVLDTEKLTDSKLSAILAEDPTTCLKINLDQHNLTLVSDGLISG